MTGNTSKGYSFLDDDFYTKDYAYTHVYYDDYYGNNYYFLPKSFDKLEAYVENINEGYYVSNTFFFDTTIEMNAGDALTVTIDANEIINNAGNGTLNWEAVQWNNIGELIFP
ncbi:MAG: hypothetical protein OCD76_02695 [Reichenbachiella sp.]